LFRFLLVLLAAGVVAERPGGFTVIGPGGGGAMYLPTISPLDPASVFVSCDMTGEYLTRDAGASWRMFNLRGRARFFVFDPKDRNVMYVQTSGLWRSSDAGQTWTMIHPDPATIRGVEMADDHAGETIVSDGKPEGQAVAMDIDPTDSRTLIAAFGNRRKASLYISKDQGKSWRAEQDFDGPVKRVYAGAHGDLYVIRGDSVSVRKNGAWRHGKSAGEFLDASLGFDSGGRAVIYGNTQQSVFVSTDDGATWTASTLPGTGAALRAIATSVHHPETAYLSYTGLRDAEGSWFGVLKTSDAGKTWAPVWREQRTAAANVHDSWITERFGPGWGEAPIGLGVAPNDPNLCYSTDLGRTMKTTDGGANWTAVYSKKTDGGYTSTGLDVTNAYGIHFDPFNGNRWFLTMTDIGLFRSENSGKSWVSSTMGVPRRLVNTTYWVEFDPEVRGRMWAAMSDTHDLPRSKMWRRAAVSSYKGGMFRSDDGGVTWKQSSEGMPPGAPTHVLLDPQSPRDQRVLYAAVFGRGVYKSVDDGRTWALKNNGIEGAEPFAWRITRVKTGGLYLVVARRSESAPGALYRSTDGAETWTRVALPEGVTGPNAITVDERDPKRLYVAAWARPVGLHGEGGGVWMSKDAGMAWRQILSDDQHVYDVTTDPKRPDVLYACGFESTAWRSTDRGATWRKIAGYDFKWGYRVIPDPFDAAKVFITTFGGGVWHGRF
jgi:photosystem II stability/assembly factor-like uncharacterized protein